MEASSLATTLPLAEIGSGDAVLIERFRAGEREAFDELYLRHHGFVYNICLGFSSDPEEAHDLAQETFVRVHRALANFRGESQFKTWVYRIAVNYCLQERRKKRPATEADPEPEPRERGDSSVEQSLEQSLEAEQVRKIVAALSPSYRSVLSLRYFEDLSYEEIAHVMGWSLSSVKVTLHRARRAFKKRWDAITQESDLQ